MKLYAYPDKYDNPNHQGKVQYDMSALRVGSSSFTPIDRAGTNSINIIPLDTSKYNMTRQLPIDEYHLSPCNVSTFSKDNQNSYTDTQTCAFVEQKKRTCAQWVSKWTKFVKKKMAFKSDVTEDPQLYTPHKKRLILTCLALGASLNGFCATIYVILKKPTLYFFKKKVRAEFVDCSFLVSQISKMK
jgi:hypothetical protein